MNTTVSEHASTSLFFNSSSSGSSENAGASRSLTHMSKEHPSFLMPSINAKGSSFESPAKSRALKICGVLSPRLGLTSNKGVDNGNGDSTSSTTSPRPVQYAAPKEKKTEMSLPMSPLHSSNSASLAGVPQSWFAAHIAVAAFPDPPPKPAPCGTFFTSSTQKYWLVPVFLRNKSSAFITRLRPSRGIVSSAHTRVSLVFEDDLANFMASPKSMTWNRLARSWNPSSRLRMIRKKRFTLEGEKNEVASAPSSPWTSSGAAATVKKAPRR
mmetsp:Transcript_4976/g.18500  ORF Transcript_4976/g.18500 Transcript_4976/m.18500 type:complete len:269 (+) Transcript_4976:219-1025(+)